MARWMTAARRCATALLLGAALYVGAPALIETAFPAMAPRACAAGPPSHAAAALSAADAERYRRIFALQEDGRWKQADAEIRALGDRVLMGHVLYQRYMHPTAYRSKFKELQGWLEQYADHPGAKAIYTLARKRGKGRLKPPTSARSVGDWGIGDDGMGDWSMEGRYRGAARRKALRVWNAYRRALSRGHTLVVKRLVRERAVRAALSRVDYDRIQSGLAYAYFVDGHDQWAREWAARALKHSGTKAPLALWAGGLAAWRQGDVTAAAGYFGRLGEAEDVSPWLSAAGAYWRARAALRLERPQDVSRWLRLAARHPRTFYGLIARRGLGLGLNFGWDYAALSASETRDLAAVPAGRRALALVEAGRLGDAAEELNRLYPLADPLLKETIVRFADAAKMARLTVSFAMYRARMEKQGDDEVTKAAFYPVPRWAPEDGWRIDRALMFAFMRQESGFDPSARSYAGARGLMQVMPSTARYIAGSDRPQLKKRRALLDPGLNMKLGQRYIEYLMALDGVSENLFFTAAAYNAGPGNLAKWRKRVKFANDPLLFVEAIPSRQTRIYIERVMANLWIYRDRLGQGTPSLDRVAAGLWPVYASLDGHGVQVAER